MAETYLTPVDLAQRTEGGRKRAKVVRPVEKLTYRPEEAAEALGVSRTTIYKEIQAGKIRTFKYGAATLIRRAELERLIDQLDPQGIGPRAA